MSKNHSILGEYESMNAEDLMVELQLVQRNISRLKSELRDIKKNKFREKSAKQSKSPFAFLLFKPPETEPSKLKQATSINIIDSSPNLSNSNKKVPIYKADASEKRSSLVNPTKIEEKLREYMNLSLNSMIKNHDAEVHDIEFGDIEKASIAEYFPK